MPGAGLEPAWGRPQGGLSPLRLPVSPPGPRAGNGTRTRDPNLGKVVLYQLSYSRAARNLSRPPLRHHPAAARNPCRRSIPTNGGEGDRTPDLVNAIHALSQLSYAPVILAAPGDF